MTELQVKSLVGLARSMSHASAQSSLCAQHSGGDINPFIDSESDPELNPHNENFNLRKWMKSILRITSRDPERYPRRTAGVSFRNLNVHGYGTAADYQADVANVWLKAYGIVKRLVGFDEKVRIDILRNFEGLVKSGEMLVVLGRPGSGCSTFLKTLAGETHGLYLGEGTSIEYQGISWDQMHNNFRGEAIYQAETESHFAHLTAGDTLYFAAKAPAPANRFPGVSRNQYALHMRDVVMAMLNLSHTVNTKVGNEYIPGVSGGERKRISIAETTLSGSPLQCWDNSTRGLDSATARTVIESLHLSTRYSGTTAIVAIYQASQAIYDIFDKAMVLYEGRQIYFGKTTHARKYFIDMGFYCPERQTTGDFLTSMTNPEERLVREGFEAVVPRTPDEFAARWQQSPDRKALLTEIEAYQKEYPLNAQPLDQFNSSLSAQKSKFNRGKSPYTISYWIQIRLCIWRGVQRLKGDLSITLTSIIGNIIMALVVASMFYNLPNDTSSFFSRGALIFFAIILNALATTLEVMTLWQQRPVVEKHHKYALYRPSAEAISSIIIDLPTKLCVAIAFNTVLYFIANLRRTPGHYFVFLLFSFSITLTMSNIFRFIASISRTFAQASPPTIVIVLGMVIYTGFTVPLRDMVVWFRWINYINPIGYAFESLMINEFHDRSFPCTTFIPAGPGYGDFDNQFKICEGSGAVAGDTFIDGDKLLNTSYGRIRIGLVQKIGSKSMDDPETGKQAHEKQRIEQNRSEEVASIAKQMSIFHWENLIVSQWVLSQRKTGYVQQDDYLHTETSTVRESLVFSALLRQPSTTPRAEKIAYVEEVIKLLGMQEYADAVVGVLGVGLNIEQRKRFSIGVEIAAKPDLLLFFDEPTSGLDSPTAWSICNLMRKLADHGQAILCTIHQPSAFLMQTFDQLLFLAAGGKTVYFGDLGENMSTLVEYFEKKGASKCPPEANPAEWMLEVIGAAPGSHTDKDWAEIWKSSPERVEVRRSLAAMKQELSQKKRESQEEIYSEFAMPLWYQYLICQQRMLQHYWRNPVYIYSKAFVAILAPLFIGFTFYNAEKSLRGLQNQLFGIFMLLLMFPTLTQQSMPFYIAMRSLYEVRERPSKTYSWKAFILSAVVVELPWNTLMAVPAFFAWYYPIGFQRNAGDDVAGRSGTMFLLIWIFLVYGSTFGSMVVSGMDLAETAGNISQLLFSMALIFCGVLATPDAMPGFWIFMYRLSPFNYFVSSVLSTGIAVMTTDDYLKQVNIYFADRWFNIGILFAFIAVNIVGAVFFYWLVRVPKMGWKAKKS
ncbi:hypothetical protein HCAG_00970 [Histoplasma mississippiense (nom. inval.)]|uniref:hypothetical protein n=1 Tax=Ajellomyces capsulatus (strain NAm1 / WU24) TaxID=2059318 RepID=UPI000157B5D7|nr:hypothetical protein HCAG_00970 [Histoplasma mississippiense (nom. inval.)]EDN03106.1 hypothetical protein HCAG_00970 [Histoplasma mississippiense (nom. inval.)]